MVREANKKGTVKIVSFDFDPGVLEAVKDGTIFGTVAQQPYEFGRQAVLVMAKYLRGDHSVIPASKQIIVPTLGIDSSDVDDFMAKVAAAGKCVCRRQEESQRNGHLQRHVQPAA